MYWKRKISQADCVLMPDSIKLREVWYAALAMANQSPNLEVVRVLSSNMIGTKVFERGHSAEMSRKDIVYYD